MFIAWILKLPLLKEMNKFYTYPPEGDIFWDYLR